MLVNVDCTAFSNYRYWLRNFVICGVLLFAGAFTEYPERIELSKRVNIVVRQVGHR
jgi:hypothetical protein